MEKGGCSFPEVQMEILSGFKSLADVNTLKREYYVKKFAEFLHVGRETTLSLNNKFGNI